MIYAQAIVAIPLGYYTGTILADLVRTWMYAAD